MYRDTWVTVGALFLLVVHPSRSFIESVCDGIELHDQVCQRPEKGNKGNDILIQAKENAAKNNIGLKETRVVLSRYHLGTENSRIYRERSSEDSSATRESNQRHRLSAEFRKSVNSRVHRQNSDFKRDTGKRLAELTGLSRENKRNRATESVTRINRINSDQLVAARRDQSRDAVSRTRSDQSRNPSTESARQQRMVKYQISIDHLAIRRDVRYESRSTARRVADRNAENRESVSKLIDLDRIRLARSSNRQETREISHTNRRMSPMNYRSESESANRATENRNSFDRRIRVQSIDRRQFINVERRILNRAAELRQSERQDRRLVRESGQRESTRTKREISNERLELNRIDERRIGNRLVRENRERESRLNVGRRNTQREVHNKIGHRSEEASIVRRERSEERRVNSDFSFIDNTRRVLNERTNTVRLMSRNFEDTRIAGSRMVRESRERESRLSKEKRITYQSGQDLVERRSLTTASMNRARSVVRRGNNGIRVADDRRQASNERRSEERRTSQNQIEDARRISGDRLVRENRERESRLYFERRNTQPDERQLVERRLLSDVSIVRRERSDEGRVKSITDSSRRVSNERQESRRFSESRLEDSRRISGDRLVKENRERKSRLTVERRNTNRDDWTVRQSHTAESMIRRERSNDRRVNNDMRIADNDRQISNERRSEERGITQNRLEDTRRISGDRLVRENQERQSKPNLERRNTNLNDRKRSIIHRVRSDERRMNNDMRIIDNNREVSSERRSKDRRVSQNRLKDTSRISNDQLVRENRERQSRPNLERRNINRDDRERSESIKAAFTIRRVRSDERRVNSDMRVIDNNRQVSSERRGEERRISQNRLEDSGRISGDRLVRESRERQSRLSAERRNTRRDDRELIQRRSLTDATALRAERSPRSVRRETEDVRVAGNSHRVSSSRNKASRISQNRLENTRTTERFTSDRFVSRRDDNNGRSRTVDRDSRMDRSVDRRTSDAERVSSTLRKASERRITGAPSNLPLKSQSNTPEQYTSMMNNLKEFSKPALNSLAVQLLKAFFIFTLFFQIASTHKDSKMMSGFLQSIPNWSQMVKIKVD